MLCRGHAHCPGATGEPDPQSQLHRLKPEFSSDVLQSQSGSLRAMPVPGNEAPRHDTEDSQVGGCLHWFWLGFSLNNTKDLFAFIFKNVI